MKHFFALPALLRTAVILASASKHTFSVNDDLLAFPQYEVQLSEKWVSEADAQSSLQSRFRRSEQPQSQQNHQSTDSSLNQDESAFQVGQYDRPDAPKGSQPADGRDGEDDSKAVDYEYAVMNGRPWLCELPVIHSSDEAPNTATNDTSSSRAEEERELTRATDRGWELLSGMQDHCVYFISGWWSYRFCYNHGVRQFHQLPPSRGVPPYPPMEDPEIAGYDLGTYAKRIDDDEDEGGEKWNGGEESALDATERGARRKRSGYGELVQRGETRYLVQRLGGGTMCDLTGKDRRTEVQFHCNPQSADRISLIKETSTCSYLMVIQTPRLCHDVAFLPPQKDRPNLITCHPILAESEVDQYELELEALKTDERSRNMWEAQARAAAAMAGDVYDQTLQVVGDILVGGHSLVPHGHEIEKSAIVGGGKETYIDTIASSDGKILSKEELEKLGLGDPKEVEKLKKNMEKLAQGQIWKLNVVDTPHGRRYRAVIGEEEEADEPEKKPAKPDRKNKGEGSEEEFYKEEL